MIIENWHKEAWIKTVSREDFILWCEVNKPEYSADQAGLIHDSHVMPKGDFRPLIDVSKEVKSIDKIITSIQSIESEIDKVNGSIIDLNIGSNDMLNLVVSGPKKVIPEVKTPTNTCCDK